MENGPRQVDDKSQLKMVGNTAERSLQDTSVVVAGCLWWAADLQWRCLQASVLVASGSQCVAWPGTALIGKVHQIHRKHRNAPTAATQGVSLLSNPREGYSVTITE